MSETATPTAPSTVGVIPPAFVYIPGELGAAMLKFYTIFYRCVDQVRQYHDGDVWSALLPLIPKEVFHMEPKEKALALARITKEWMLPFDKSPALRRYERITAIIQNRRGRCGEFANLYTALCTVAGLEARFIFDSTDHNWTEVRIDSQWVPIDTTLGEVLVSPFARALDGKPITWILAFGPSNAEDVTFRYVPPEQVKAVEQRRDAFSPLPEILIETFNMGAEFSEADEGDFTE